MFTIMLKDLGGRPLKVRQGENLHICMMPQEEDSRRCWYEYEDRDFMYRDLTD